MSNKNKPTIAKFYKEPAMVEEVHTGFLQKSPASPTIAKNILTQKSWKRRFFVLSKSVDNNYQLTYYTSNEKRDKPLGKIELSKISLLFIGPETHPMWEWIQKYIKCPPTSVLFLTVETRDYFLIGQNSEEVDGWLNAIVTALKKIQNKLKTDNSFQDNRIRSISAPLKCPEPKTEDQPDERWSAPALMSSISLHSHYDYPRKLSEPPVPAERKVSVCEVQDEKDKEEDTSPERSSEYMCMASVQMVLEDDQKGTSTTCVQSSNNSRKPSVCNNAVNQETDDEHNKMNNDKRKSDPRQHSQSHHHSFNGNSVLTELDKAASNKSEMHTHEKEICISQDSLKNSLILTQQEGKPCVSDCKQIQDSCLFHKGDQILAFNDLLIDTVEEIETYLRRLSKDEVKLTIRRIPGSQPLHCEACPSH